MNNLNDFQDVYIGKVSVKNALTGWVPGDPPLLDELGINFNTIKKESTLILRIFRRSQINYSFLENADLTGPILFTFLFSLFLLLNGKIHFGYVYFISITSTFFIYFLLNVMGDRSIDMIKCCSVMGYSLLPIVGFALTNIFCGWINLSFKLATGCLVSIWAASVSSIVFVNYLEMGKKIVLVGYPLLMVYTCFTLLVIF
jgi:hypothetical protein